MNLKKQSRMIEYKYKTKGKIMNNNRGITNNKLATNNGVEMGAIAHEQS
jgi:hypothetical protein